MLLLNIYVIFVKKHILDMSTKELILETVRKMPDGVTFDELLDELIFIKKVQTGLEQSEKGNVVSTDEAKKRLKKWLK